MRRIIYQLSDLCAPLVFSSLGLTISYLLIFDRPGVRLDNPGEWFLFICIGFLASFYLALSVYFLVAGVLAVLSGVRNAVVRAGRFAYGVVQAYRKNTR